MLELTDVPRPRVARQDLQRFRLELRDVAPGCAGVLLQEVRSQQSDVPLALLQRRQPYREHVQPVEQVLAEAPPGDLRPKIAVRGRDHSHVHLTGSLLPTRRISFSWSAVQLHLAGERQLPYLVEEDGPAFGFLEEASLGPGAPVNDPFACPKSLLSTRSGGSAPQFTGTKRHARLAD
jgi:hypothetical protein